MLTKINHDRSTCFMNVTYFLFEPNTPIKALCLRLKLIHISANTTGSESLTLADGVKKYKNIAQLNITCFARTRENCS